MARKARFRKGSPEAKRFMARLRAKRKSNPSSKKRVPRTRRTLIKQKTKRTMARKRTTKRRSSRRRGMFGALQKPLVAGITYAFVQPILSTFLSRFNIGIQDELVQILGAVVIKNVARGPIVNAWANAAIIINTASLVGGFAGQFFGGGSSHLAAPVANSGVVLIG